MRKFFRRIIFLVNIVFAMALLATYLVPFVNPRDFWLPPLLGLIQLYLFLINVGFVGFWLMFKWKYLLFSLACILIGYNNIGNYIRYTPCSTDQDDVIKVITYNVHNFYSYFENKSNNTDIIDFISDQNADIICLQETAIRKKGDLSITEILKKFRGSVNYYLPKDNRSGGPVTFTRFPIVKSGEINFEGTSNMVIYTDVLFEKDTMRIYNCHLQSFGIIKDEYSLIDSMRLETEKLIEAKLLGGKLRRGNAKRAEQVIALAKHIKDCRYERIIVCGDFNDIPNSYTYSQITNLLDDAFVGSGIGTSNTFRYNIAPYRIDYVFHSEHFSSCNYKRHKVDYSDHYPISVVLKYESK